MEDPRNGKILPLWQGYASLVRDDVGAPPPDAATNPTSRNRSSFGQANSIIWNEPFKRDTYRNLNVNFEM